MNLLILKKFNNYFNRKVKKYSDLDSYEDISDSYTHVLNVNFNPNDEVRTELVLGKGELNGFFDFEKTDSADYLVCYTSVTENNITTNTIESRWFITEVVRTRGGQYKLQLKRDSIADKFDSLLTCPAYIKKGIVTDDNPLILTSEGIGVNQIKKGEELLKDNTNTSWLVGYMPKNGGTDGNVSVQIPTKSFGYETIESLAASLGVDSVDLNNALTTNSSNPTYFVNDNIEVIGWVNLVDSTAQEYRFKAGTSNGFGSFSYSEELIQWHNKTSDCFAKAVATGAYDFLPDKSKTYWLNALNYYKANIKAAWKTITTHPLFTKNVFNKLSQLEANNTIIYKSGSYYRIRVGQVLGPTNTGETYYASALSSPFAAVCSKFVTDYNATVVTGEKRLQLVDHGVIFLNYNELIANFYLEKVTDLSDIPGISFAMSSTRNACTDQVYDMFAIPYNNVTIMNGNDSYTGIGEYSQQLAVAIAEKMSAGSYDLYDLQLLPYCPIPEIGRSNGSINISSLSAAYDYDYIYQTGSTVRQTDTGYCEPEYDYDYQTWNAIKIVTFDVPYSSVSAYGTIINQMPTEEVRQYNTSKTSYNGGTQTRVTFWANTEYEQTADNINVSIWIEYPNPNPVISSIVIYPKSASFSTNINKTLSLTDSMKIESQCNNYRLVSPNYQGSFDFNVAKNGGRVDGFVAECTYKPYTPYIKVTPNFA